MLCAFLEADNLTEKSLSSSSRSLNDTSCSSSSFFWLSIEVLLSIFSFENCLEFSSLILKFSVASAISVISSRDAVISPGVALLELLERSTFTFLLFCSFCKSTFLVSTICNKPTVKMRLHGKKNEIQMSLQTKVCCILL
ncbi:hypothetical protein OIU74_025642 [Salix koriyanagi]|uniref:Uncharacterized protein n=1 Tax=Salix koriyanagi TaxID=2511006 RepID=A0A9Q0W1L4_9ROSI|nr:hypothetical protein OIU74_025642 [Salix koriyanagi]